MTQSDLPDDETIVPAAGHSFDGPIPTQNVASEEYLPAAQTAAQREVEARLKTMGDEIAKKHGISRRRFFQTISGMAAGFLAMNQVYGQFFAVAAAEAATPDVAAARADALKDQFIMDLHTHHLHESMSQDVFDMFLSMRGLARAAGWNPVLPDRPGTNADLLYDNYIKEIFLDSDTKVALISSAPGDNKDDYFLSNDQMLDDRRRTNEAAGSRRLMAHFILTPGHAGLLEAVDRAIETTHPDSWKGYTIGDPLVAVRKGHISKYPWRLDDEKLAYPIYERIARSQIRNVCIHKGLFPPSAEKQFPELRRYADVSDVGKAAKDWPQLNFIIYHAGYRHAGGGDPAFAMAEFDRTGRVDWATDLGEIPARYGVTNVYADIGESFAETIVAQPRLAAALMGTLIKGLGSDHVVWGTDALWTGSPQWQIEGLRRLEIPEAMQKRYGFAALGAADGPVKAAIFGENSARLYNYQRHAELGRPDLLHRVKAEYQRSGAQPSNLRYGYVRTRV
jgi:predicted TIM-barrel fold metal-dependent hydrolase